MKNREYEIRYALESLILEQYNDEDLKVNPFLVDVFYLIIQLEVERDICKEDNHKKALELITCNERIKELSAELEEFKMFEDKLRSEKEDVMYYKQQIRAEAVREFAEMLKEKAIQKFDWNEYVEIEEIDNLVKEMECDNK